MHEPFQVIEGGNPDDSFAQSEVRPRLTLVHATPAPTATPAVTTFPRSRTLRIVDAIIGILMRIRSRIESDDQRRHTADAQSTDTPRFGKGW